MNLLNELSLAYIAGVICYIYLIFRNINNMILSFITTLSNKYSIQGFLFHRRQFEMFFLNENYSISIQIPLNRVTCGSFNNNLSLVQVMASHFTNQYWPRITTLFDVTQTHQKQISSINMYVYIVNNVCGRYEMFMGQLERSFFFYFPRYLLNIMGKKYENISRTRIL